jgi:hypothetical protein
MLKINFNHQAYFYNFEGFQFYFLKHKKYEKIEFLAF